MKTIHTDENYQISIEFDSSGNLFAHCDVFKWSHNIAKKMTKTMQSLHKDYDYSAIFVVADRDNTLLPKFLDRLGFTYYISHWTVEHNVDKIVDIFKAGEINDYSVKRHSGSHRG